MPQPVNFFEIRGKDGNRSRDFYASLFGWNIGADPNGRFVQAADGGIGGIITESADEPPMATVYVEVPDTAAALEKAVGLGGKVIQQPMNVGEEPGSDHVHVIAVFADLDGNPIGLVSGH
jgi:uncharacterized protein